MSDQSLQGFAFPFRIENGGIARAEGFEKIRQNIIHLLSTRLGERVIRRTYGGGAHHRLQSPNDTTLRALVKHEIEQALSLHFPDLRLVAPLKVTAKEAELKIVLEYAALPEDIVHRLELQIP